MKPQQALDALETGGVAVTVNRRLSRVLNKTYDHHQTAKGKKAWPAAEILPWDTWLRTLFHTLRDSEESPVVLLSSAQVAGIWEQVVVSSEVTGELLDVRAAAAQAQAAWALQQAWGVRVQQQSSPDQNAYVEWRREYRKRCERNGWLDPDSLETWLAPRLSGVRASLPDQLLVLGIDTLSQARQSLIDALRDCGVDVTVDDLPGSERSNATLLTCVDERHEITQVARWARAQLQNDPEWRIGIVVPDLSRQREALLEAIDKALEPSTALCAEQPLSPHYNVSLGVSLANYPMIAEALGWLRWMDQPLALEQYTHLMRSAYIAAGQSERSERAVADNALRGQARRAITLPGFAAVLRRLGEQCPAQLTERIEALVKLGDELPARQSHAAWARSIEQILECLGWPGGFTLNSEEFQLHAAWQQTLQKLAEFDVIHGDCRYSEAVARLSTLVQNNVFQLESDSDAPLQIVGLLEVTGMQFDSLWVMGMDDHSWPQRPQLNPFLPVAAQRAAGVPHNSAAWESGFAERTLRRLYGSAGELIFSYAVRQGDAQFGPSTLLGNLPVAAIGTVVSDSPGWPRTQLQSLDDSMAPGLPQGSEVRGGVSVLSDQADCPFRAFARHRLGAEPQDQPQTGVSASERGSLLHQAMEHLWRALQNQSTLLALDDEALRGHIETALDTAIAEQRLAADTAFVDIERAQMVELILAWLAVDKQRDDFRIDSLEQRHSLAVGGLNINVRIDRADELASGERLLIDYKTGNPKNAPPTAGLLEPRPRDLQLPIYSLAYPQAVNAVALAFVRPLQSQFKGIGDEEFSVGKPGGIKTSGKLKSAHFEGWEQLQQFWREEVTALAEEFVGGVASVTPRQYPQTCKHCALDPLCRVTDSLQATEAGEHE